MGHLKPLPGDPGYDAEKGVSDILEAARRDLHALQDGGVDAVMFSNEASLPYLLENEAITSITMARIIGELMGEIKIPFGVNVLWDPMASIDLAVATGAVFVREIFTGVYGSDFGLWNTNGSASWTRRLSSSNTKVESSSELIKIYSTVWCPDRKRAKRFWFKMVRSTRLILTKIAKLI